MARSSRIDAFTVSVKPFRAGGPQAFVRKPTSSNKKSPAEATAGEVQFQQDTHPGVVYQNTGYVSLFPLYGAKFSAFPDAVLRTLPRV
jgi:hypothetical protein